jgi:hypothetical protein
MMIVLNNRHELAAAALSRRTMFAVVTVLARPRGQPKLACWLRDYGEAPLQGARNDAVPKPLAALADQIAAPNLLRSGLEAPMTGRCAAPSRWTTRPTSSSNHPAVARFCKAAGSIGRCIGRPRSDLCCFGGCSSCGAHPMTGSILLAIVGVAGRSSPRRARRFFASASRRRRSMTSREKRDCLEYREPRITTSIFGALVLAAALTTP